MMGITGAARCTINNRMHKIIPSIRITFLRSRILIFVNRLLNFLVNPRLLRPAPIYWRRLARGSLAFLFLPAALLLAQHGVWAHGFSHDVGKIHGQAQNDVRHDCCLAFEAAGDAAGAAQALSAAAPVSVAAHISAPAGRCVRAPAPYASRAPPLCS